jgi:hypothetical protein
MVGQRILTIPERTCPVVSEFEVSCRAAQRVLLQCVGAFIGGISVVAIGAGDRLDLRLVQVQSLGEVVLSLEKIHYISLSKPPEIDQSFVDEIAVYYLPKLSDEWPEIANGLVGRFPTLPELICIELKGPTSLLVIAEIVTLAGLVSLSDGI